MMRYIPAGILVALALAVTACNSSSQAATRRPPKSHPAARSAFVRVDIVVNPSHHPDSWYRPNPVRARVGQSIIWFNHDSDPHDVTADGGAFASGPIAADGFYRLIARKPGRYPYFCTLHPDMHGVVIVTR